jgi:hypothetical protein
VREKRSGAKRQGMRQKEGRKDEEERERDHFINEFGDGFLFTFILVLVVVGFSLHSDEKKRVKSRRT